jgi:hypothetical protein
MSDQQTYDAPEEFDAGANDSPEFDAGEPAEPVANSGAIDATPSGVDYAANPGVSALDVVNAQAEYEQQPPEPAVDDLDDDQWLEQLDADDQRQSEQAQAARQQLLEEIAADPQAAWAELQQTRAISEELRQLQNQADFTAAGNAPLEGLAKDLLAQQEATAAEALGEQVADAWTTAGVPEEDLGEAWQVANRAFDALLEQGGDAGQEHAQAIVETVGQHFADRARGVEHTTNFWGEPSAKPRRYEEARPPLSAREYGSVTSRFFGKGKRQ